MREILNDMQSVKLSDKALSAQVANRISSLIAKNNIQQGEQIPTELELAEQFNVGRGTVREAIKILVARNILEIRRGRGTFVANRTGVIDDPFGLEFMEDKPRLAREIYEIRMEFEPWIAAMAAERATDEDIARLRQWQEKCEEALTLGFEHRDDLIYADGQLHRAVAMCTHNRIIPLMLPAITYSVYLFLNLKSAGNNVRPTIETHKKIVDAIAAHDPEAARAAMIDHVATNKKVFGEVAEA